MKAKGRIVVIDNDEVTLTTVRAMLEAEGYEVMSAISGLAANEYIYGAAKPDLILLDVMMPFQDGISKVQFLKERESSRSIPVVLMSSKSRRELRDLAESSGASGYLVKPVGREALLEAIESLRAKT